jgi:hypothetical protein
MVLDLIHVYQYHTPQKKSPKKFTHNPSFEVYMQKIQIMWCVILSQIYSIHSFFSLFVRFLEKLIRLSFKLIKCT